MTFTKIRALLESAKNGDKDAEEALRENVTEYMTLIFDGFDYTRKALVESPTECIICTSPIDQRENYEKYYSPYYCAECIED